MSRPIDQIETELFEVTGLVARLDAARVRLIRELDVAQVAATDGSRSLVEWVASRLDVESENARRLVDLARADERLDAEMDDGMTVDRAAAVTRLRAEGASEETIASSFGFNLAGMRRLIATHRHLTSENEQDVAESRYLHLQPNLDESVWNLWGRLTGVDGRTVEKALRTEVDSLPNDPDTTTGQDLADALVSVSAQWLDGVTGDASSPTAEIIVDAALATSSESKQGVTVVGGPRVGPQILEEILCAGTVNVTVTGDQLQTVRTAGTTIPAATRAFVFHRDGHACVIDGCGSRSRLQPHHIRPRSEGGDHHPDNLVTLCWFHHHISIHQRGLALDPDSPPQRRRFLRPTARSP